MIQYKFSCPHCHQRLEGDETYSGHQISCPVCKQPFVVPQAPQQTASPRPVQTPLQAARPTPSTPTAPIPQPGARIQPPGKPERSNLALASLILSILQLNIPAIVCGHMAKARMKKNPLMTGRGMATAGLVIGYVSLAISVAMLIVALSFVGAVMHTAKNAMREAEAKAKIENSKAGQADGTEANEGQNAASILQTVSKQLQSFSSYSGSGTCTLDLDMSKVSPSSVPAPENMKNSKDFEKGFKQATQQRQKMNTDFEFRLARPNQYRIEWTRNIAVMNQTITQKGAVWCTGEEHFLLSSEKTYSKMGDRTTALGAAGGASGGAVGIMASLFFSEALNDYKDCSKGEDETIDGEDCYVISGTATQQQMTFWITKSGHLIKQQKLEFGGRKSTEPDEKQMKKTMESMGQKPTPENMERMKKMMKGVTSMMAQMKGSMLIKYQNVETNKTFTDADFKYEVPKGAKLQPLMATPPF